MSTLSDILAEVEKKGGKEDIEVELSKDLPEPELNRLREQLFMMGFELRTRNTEQSSGDADSKGKSDDRKLVLKKESYNELVVKEVSNTLTPKSATLRSKKDNFIDKSQKMEEELAAIRAEKAKQYKSSSNNTSSSTGGACNSTNGGRGPSNSQSSFRRFMNFDWFTSMFSSQRRGTSQRDRMHLDSSYYRSKNTGCCGQSCGGS